MKCPVIDYHKNRTIKWWLKYIGFWILAFISCGIIQWENIDEWTNKSNKQKDGDVK